MAWRGDNLQAPIESPADQLIFGEPPLVFKSLLRDLVKSISSRSVSDFVGFIELRASSKCLSMHANYSNVCCRLLRPIYQELLVSQNRHTDECWLNFEASNQVLWAVNYPGMHTRFKHTDKNSLFEDIITFHLPTQALASSAVALAHGRSKWNSLHFSQSFPAVLCLQLKS